MRKIIALIIVFWSVQVSAQVVWDKVSAGGEFSLGLRSDGTLWSWGFNGSGQLGIGTTSLVVYQTTPVQVGTDNDWLEISAGGYHSLALKSDGTLWVWGFNMYGGLGNGGTVDTNLPVQITEENDWLTVEAGQVHSFAIKQDGTLWGWGYGGFGQLGLGNDEDVAIPTQIGEDNDWSQIIAGGAHTLALKNDGSLWGWGVNGNGQLGDGMNSTTLFIPTHIGTDTWEQISAGYEYSAGIKEDGTLWTWGFNVNGQLGIGSTTQQNSPIQVGTDTWSFVEAGAAHLLAIRTDGTLHGAGVNIFGQLGLTNVNQQNTLVMINPEIDWQVVSGAVGIASQAGLFGMHTLVLKSDASIVCVAGANYVDQLGTNTGGDNVEAISCLTGLILSTNELVLDNSLLVYPNPASDVLNVELEENRITLLEVYDITGKQVLSQQNKLNRVSIDISGFPSGIYQLKIQSDNGSISRKFVKQ